MMNRNFLIRYGFPVLVVLSFILAACATPTPEVVVETVTVKEIVVETVVVVEEKEVEIEKLVTPTAGPPPEVVYLRFYFPVGVAGSLAPKMEAMVDFCWRLRTDFPESTYCKCCW
jgi:hypothetical protein